MKEMWAVVKKEPVKGATLSKVAVPCPGAGEVLVKVKAAALCGTDLHVYQWNSWAKQAGVKTPMIMGHEFSGEVVEVGEGVSTVKRGDYVVGETHIPCGTCYQCKNGLQHICGNMVIYGVNTDGCFAEYAKIPEICAKKIPESISPEVGAILEPLGTSLRSCLELQVGGENVVVIGAGPIGLLAVASAKALGAAYITAVDVLPQRLEKALEMGADHVCNPQKEKVAEDIMKITKGVGADSIIDASGNTAAIREGFRYLRKGGQAALIGLPSNLMEIDLGPDVIFKEATIKGIHGRKMFETWTRMENMLENEVLKVREVITHIISLADFAEGFNLIENGEACKVILIPEG